MSSDQWSRLIIAVAQLLGVLVWPAAVLFIIWVFRGVLSGFLSNLGELNVKAPGGLEATAKRQVTAAVALGAAVARQTPADDGSGQIVDLREVARALPSPRDQRRLRGSRALWVDDNPRNNRYESQALEALGIQIDTSLSTDDALSKLRQREYDLIISDMGRPPDPRAGYTLLDRIREAGNRTPFIIYAGSQDPEHVREAREHGAIGCTNHPQYLIEMVTDALTATR